MLYKKDHPVFSRVKAVSKIFDPNYNVNYPKNYDPSVKFTTRELLPSTGGGQARGKPIRISLVEVFEFYHQCRNKGPKDLDGLRVPNFAQNIIGETLFNEGHGATNPFLKTYPSLVQQVGYLKRN